MPSFLTHCWHPGGRGQGRHRDGEEVGCTSGGAHGREPGLPCLGPGSQLHSGPLPLSVGVSVSPHPRSLLVSSVSRDKTPAGSPVPAGSGAFTGELGRQAGNRVRGRRGKERSQKERQRHQERRRKTPTYREKQNETEKVRDPVRETGSQKRQTARKRQRGRTETQWSLRP